MCIFHFCQFSDQMSCCISRPPYAALFVRGIIILSYHLLEPTQRPELSLDSRFLE